MKEQRYKGVFFDLYGTLLVYGDMERAWEEWLDSILASMRKNGAEIERDALKEICSGFFNKPEPPTDSNHTIYERRIGALGEQLGITLEGSEKTAISDHSVHSWTKYTTVDSEATRILSEVHGSMRTGLISNFDHPPHVRSRLQESGFERYFDVVVISGEVGIKKPSPEIFSIAIAETGLQPSEVAFVGDSIDDDMMGAAAAGLTPILIDRHDGKRRVASDYGANHDSKPRGPDPMMVIASLGGLREILFD